ncbi:MAG: RNA polymerase sigma factor RpoD/SigA [Fibrobacterota bacterium]|nr:RNA polymerase sigma factor RpoD/SigA [Fibrobacterota bacterium]QQS06810.1 MAG: RNA polymerase sigma factor RpoD/SigA [Fibrobacterota bacterium]
MASLLKESWEGATLYNQYIKDIQRYRLLTRAEERAILDKLAKGDERAKERLIVSNLRFVVNVAFLYRNQGLSLPELINEGNVGLIEAAGRFDTSRDLKFISYAVWWIRQSITRAIAEKARLVRISAEKELILRRFSKVNHPVSQAIGGAWVTDSTELGRRMEMSSESVEKVIEMGQRHASLDSKLDEEGDSSLMDMIQDDEIVLPDAHVEAIDELANLQEMVANLPDMERKVLCMYFGVGYGEAFNLQEIGKVVGLSKERVRQIKEKALGRIREQAGRLALAA